MKIKNSLEWENTRRELKSNIEKLPYDPSVRQMIKNIDRMVTELSKIEVDARRTRIPYYKDAQVTKINDSIDVVEKIILIATLSL